MTQQLALRREAVHDVKHGRQIPAASTVANKKNTPQGSVFNLPGGDGVRWIDSPMLSRDLLKA